MTAPARALKLPVLRMNLGCDFARIRTAAERVKHFLEESGCDDGARADCELAVVEACNNAIKHAYPDGRRLPVFLEVRIEPHHIELRIIDHGPGFVWPNSINLPDPDNESGRGLFLIRVLMDYAVYLRGSKQNILLLRKRRSSA